MFGVRREDRACLLAIVLAAHLLIAWLVLSLAHTRFVRDRDAVLDVFDVRPVAPPPPVEPPPTPSQSVRRSARPEDPSGAPRTSVQQAVAPPSAASIVPVSGSGSPPGAGNPQWRMSGGGAGSGAGSDSAGAETGGGGRPAVAARLRGGRIVPRDYPRAAGGRQGVVTAHVAVAADGRVSGCTVAQSSGSPILDAATCRLIRERFRFTPARNARGEAVPDLFGWQQRWWRD